MLVIKNSDVRSLNFILKNLQFNFVIRPDHNMAWYVIKEALFYWHSIENAVLIPILNLLFVSEIKSRCNPLIRFTLYECVEIISFTKQMLRNQSQNICRPSTHIGSYLMSQSQAPGRSITANRVWINFHLPPSNVKYCALRCTHLSWTKMNYNLLWNKTENWLGKKLKFIRSRVVGVLRWLD